MPQMETVQETADPLNKIIDEELARIESEKADRGIKEAQKTIERTISDENRRLRIANFLIDINATLRKALISSKRLRSMIEEKQFFINNTNDGSDVINFWVKGISYPTAVALCLCKKAKDEISIQLYWSHLPYGYYGPRTTVLNCDQYAEIPVEFEASFKELTDQEILVRAIVRVLS